jgi:predicted nucleic acid-binding protein
VTVFADTSYFIARVMARDQWSGRAKEAAQSGVRLLTSAPVISETVSLLQQRGHTSGALEFLHEIRHDADLMIVYLDAPLQSEAWDLFQRYAGSGANATDCASFAIMRRFSIKMAFTFDEHFRHAGFDILR